ncbi:hypothetical protein C0989_008102 [Termitomyces sp. Mn162]|nr:hypothetical protein C0989_008102 [Termitomyces sp. Mn162]
MQQDVAMGQALSKEEWIKALECELFALRQPGEKFDGIQVPHAAYQPANNTPKVTPPTSDTSVTSSSSGLTSAPAAKPVDKGKASECTIVNEQPPIVKEPVAQPPIHPFSGIPGCYVPPANRNFAAPDRTNNGAYQTMPPIYNIEQSKAVFKWVLSTKDPSDIFEDILLTFAVEEPQFLLGSNVDTVNGLTLDRAPFASVDPIKAYIDPLPRGEEPVVLTVTKDSQSLCTVMMLIDNKEEVECIHDSGSQIILMSAEIANDLGLSYDPNIVLNMQSANGTMDRLLGLAQNVPCTIGNIMTNPALAYLYTMASDISDLSLPPRSYLVSADTSNPLILGQTLPLDTHITDITPTYVNIPFPAQFVTNEPPKQRGVQIKKKYKPVAMKTKPVTSHVSKNF